MKTTIELEMHDLVMIGMCVTFCWENLDKFYERWMQASNFFGLPTVTKDEVNEKLSNINQMMISESTKSLIKNRKDN